MGKAEDLVILLKMLNMIPLLKPLDYVVMKIQLKHYKNMAKLLKPGGRIVLLEHGRSNWGFINNHLDFRSEKEWKLGNADGI